MHGLRSKHFQETLLPQPKKSNGNQAQAGPSARSPNKMLDKKAVVVGMLFVHVQHLPTYPFSRHNPIQCSYLERTQQLLSLLFFSCWVLSKEERWIGLCLEKGYVGRCWAWTNNIPIKTIFLSNILFGDLVGGPACAWLPLRFVGCGRRASGDCFGAEAMYLGCQRSPLCYPDGANMF